MFESLTLIWTFFVSEELLRGRCLSFESCFSDGKKTVGVMNNRREWSHLGTVIPPFFSFFSFLSSTDPLDPLLAVLDKGMHVFT